MVKISFSSEEQLYIFIPSASKGIKNIAEKFSKDIYSTSNQEPIIKEEFTNVKQAVIIVTLTECEDKIIEELSTRLEGVHLISGKYESYDIEMIENIFGVENALVICGSDRLGSIYGMFFVSKLLGVSPQVWFGDATPMKYRKINFKSQVIDDLENNVELETGIFRKISKERNKKDIYISRYTSKEPIIRYRGFFINDEWPCFGNWAMEHFGGLNSKMYEHIFEYLLRLNGNYLWPAMWNSAFMEDDKESIRLANSYGIYIGMSHHEPCNRSGIEYSRLRGKDSIYGDAWDYRINKNKILKFWEDGLKRSAGFRTIPTIGMRGENDSKLLEEGADITSNVEVLKDIIKNQYSGDNKYEFNNRRFKTSIGIGMELSRNTLFLLSGGYQISHVKGNPDDSLNSKYKFPYIEVSITQDNRDSIMFPTNGTYLKVEYTKANSREAKFDALYAKGEINIPLGEKVTFTPSVAYITSNGEKIPETYRPKLGGFQEGEYSLEFAGLPTDRLRGNSIFVGKLNLQYQLSRIIFIGANVSLATISDKSFSFGKERKESYGIGFGVRTPLGPGYFGVAKTQGESIKYFLNFGYQPKAFNEN